MIHGYLSDPEDFGQLPKAMEHLYDEISMPLLPGHGPNADIHDFTMEKTIELVKEKYMELASRCDQIDVFGMSMGGALATWVAGNNPVNKLVLLAPANHYFSPNFGFRRVKYLFQATKETRAEEKKENPKVRVIPYFVDVFKKMLKNDTTAFKYAMSIYKDRLNFGSFRTLRKVVRYCNDNLQKISCPTLILWGYLDELVPLRSVEYCLECCTNENKELVIIPGVGHMMLRAENMEKAIEKIVAFLEENDGCQKTND